MGFWPRLFLLFCLGFRTEAYRGKVKRGFWPQVLIKSYSVFLPPVTPELKQYNNHQKCESPSLDNTSTCLNQHPPLQKCELHSRIKSRPQHFVNMHPQTKSKTTPTSPEAPPFSNLQGLSNSMWVSSITFSPSAFNCEPPRIYRKRAWEKTMK